MGEESRAEKAVEEVERQEGSREKEEEKKRVSREEMRGGIMQFHLGESAFD